MWSGVTVLEYQLMNGSAAEGYESPDHHLDDSL
jgi:hypothetical protein